MTVQLSRTFQSFKKFFYFFEKTIDRIYTPMVYCRCTLWNIKIERKMEMASWERKLYRSIGKTITIERKNEKGETVKEIVKIGFGPYNKVPFNGR